MIATRGFLALSVLIAPMGVGAWKATQAAEPNAVTPFGDPQGVAPLTTADGRSIRIPARHR